MIEPLVVTVVVRAPPGRAFAAFTGDIDTWWPRQPYSMAQGTLTLAAHPGGQIIETARDGTTYVWGHITDWQPPRQLAFDWYVGRGPESATQVTVTFDATDQGHTAVTVTQTGWEALGVDALPRRTRYNAGWQDILANHFARFLENT